MNHYHIFFLTNEINCKDLDVQILECQEVNNFIELVLVDFDGIVFTEIWICNEPFMELHDLKIKGEVKAVTQRQNRQIINLIICTAINECHPHLGWVIR